MRGVIATCANVQNWRPSVLLDSFAATRPNGTIMGRCELRTLDSRTNVRRPFGNECVGWAVSADCHAMLASTGSAMTCWYHTSVYRRVHHRYGCAVSKTGTVRRDISLTHPTGRSMVRSSSFAHSHQCRVLLVESCCCQRMCHAIVLGSAVFTP